ncbi:MAG: threonine ammonia-lyase [Firmicutes bacterium]|nr:threonine ammonia-lyase [Bacillota bacterium]
MITLDKIYHASYVLKEVVRRTDLIPAPTLCPGSEIYIKPENLQITGSFKVRGAYYKISRLSEEERRRGVIACSAGNHAQGVALAAQRSGIHATICLPDIAPISKVEATRRYGAEICLVPGVYDDAYQRALQLRDEKGYTFIHPFNDEDVIAGQGSIGLELLDQLPDLDAVIVPIGGGGLISGVAFAIKSLNPRVKVYGVQASGANSMGHSLELGYPDALPRVTTFADGIAVKCPGDQTYDLVHRYVDEIVTVSEDEIATAVLALIEKHKLIAEGAGAVSIAAAMFHKLPIEGKKVICLVSGGNIDVTILSRVISRGLLQTGRTLDVTLALSDRPGQLTQVSRIISEHGGNVVSVIHDRSDLGMQVTDCFLRLSLETRDHAHADEIRQALTDAGFTIVN